MTWIKLKMPETLKTMTLEISHTHTSPRLSQQTSLETSDQLLMPITLHQEKSKAICTITTDRHLLFLHNFIP